MTSKILSWDKQSSATGTLYPVSREGHSLTYIPEMGILMFGGLGSDLFSEFFYYDPSEHNWNLINIKGRYPTPRCYHQAFYMDPYFIIYAGQGDRGRSLGDMYLLNLKDKKCEWKRMITVNPPEYRHQHTLVGDETIPNTPIRYMFGGINTPNNNFFNDLWVFDFSNGILGYDRGSAEVSGIIMKSLKLDGVKPKERKGHISFMFNNKVYIYGGQTKDIEDDTMKHIFYADLNKKQWFNIENKSADISPRSLQSCTWYNDTTLIVSLKLR